METQLHIEQPRSAADQRDLPIGELVKMTTPPDGVDPMDWFVKLVRSDANEFIRRYWPVGDARMLGDDLGPETPGHPLYMGASYYGVVESDTMKQVAAKVMTVACDQAWVVM